MAIDKMLEMHDLAKLDAGKYPHKRFLYDLMDSIEGRHFIGIVGPRGAGKTVLLRQYAREHPEAFYISADTLGPEEDLWESVRTLADHYGFKVFLIDEAHFLQDLPGLFKKMYDFLDIRLIFSSSVALAIRESAYDLSRRVRLLTLPNFSFREYLALKQDIHLPSLSLGELSRGEWEADHQRASQFFDAYLLRGGNLPFSIEEPNPLPLLENTVEKIIARDIPSVIKITLDELDNLRRMLRFIGRSGVDGINYSNLSRNLGITKYKAEQYVDCLEKAFVLHRVWPDGTNVLREPKVLMSLPHRLLYLDHDNAIGGLREDFFVEMLWQAELDFRYLKSTRGAKTPDFIIKGKDERLVVEVGGKGKGREQFKGVEYDRKLVFADVEIAKGDKIPLFLAGFLS